MERDENSVRVPFDGDGTRSPFAYPCTVLYFLAGAGGDRRGVGVRGGGAAAAVRRPPRPRRGRGRGRHPGRPAGGRALPVAGRPPTGRSSSPRWGPTTSTGLDVVFLALPHGESQELAPGLVDRVGLLVDLAADFRLRDAGGLPALVRARPRRPELLGRVRLRPARAVPRRPRRAPGWWPRRGAIRRRRPWRSRRSCGPG